VLECISTGLRTGYRIHRPPTDRQLSQLQKSHWTTHSNYHCNHSSHKSVLSSPDVSCLSLSLSLNLILRPTVIRPAYLEIKHQSGAYDQIFLLSESCGFVDMGRSVWREDGSVVYNCSWTRQRSHFRARVSWNSWLYFSASDSRLPFIRLVRLTGLRWRYSTPPPHGIDVSWQSHLIM
jgi:hypothetical protein